MWVNKPQSVRELAQAFLLQKQVGGCSAKTVRVYSFWLERLVTAIPAVDGLDPLAVTRFFAQLRERHLKPTTLHQAYRVLRTFFRWGRAMGVITSDPLAGLTMRTPQTLPTVPTEEELRAVVRCCNLTPEGRRNRAMLLLMVDAGLRQSEVRRLLIEHVAMGGRTIIVRQGKGAKDRVAALSPITVRALRTWIAVHPEPRPEAFLFTSRDGRPLTERHLVQICHRLSKRAGLHVHRRIHPHLLRHLAATSWLRNGMGLDEVRRLLGHTSLQTTLRYSSLVSADVQAAHRRAAAIERMRLE